MPTRTLADLCVWICTCTMHTLQENSKSVSMCTAHRNTFLSAWLRQRPIFAEKMPDWGFSPTERKASSTCSLQSVDLSTQNLKAYLMPSCMLAKLFVWTFAAAMRTLQQNSKSVSMCTACPLTFLSTWFRERPNLSC